MTLAQDSVVCSTCYDVTVHECMHMCMGVSRLRMYLRSTR